MQPGLKTTALNVPGLTNQAHTDGYSGYSRFVATVSNTALGMYSSHHFTRGHACLEDELLEVKSVKDEVLRVSE